MDLSSIANELSNIESNQFGLNKLLLNLILQIFLKNNIDDPNDIIITISEYLDVNPTSTLIIQLANQLNIMWNGSNWVWIEC
tara:strand:- start:7360 stop:7605 length:246 start_codon:yes stop_codon:yes gene_type:complete